MPKQKVLVVDDEPTIREVVELYLKREGYEVLTTADGASALAAVERHKPDLVLLDLMLPGIDGLTVCNRLRARDSHLPIIMLTAKGEETDRVVGLEMGADDYISKPFSPREVVARVKAVLRRTQAPETDSSHTAEPAIRAGNVQIDPRTRVATVNGNAVDLTVKEFDLLYFLARHAGQVFTRAQLMDKVWGYDFYGDASTVTVHVRRLREKVEPDPTQPQHVMTVWGVGYKFDPGE